MNDYLLPLLGGLLIGASAVIFMLLLGRIAGISSLFWRATEPRKFNDLFSSNYLWAWLFIIGLPLGAWIAKVLFSIEPQTGTSDNTLLALVAGLLVGFGAKLGSGCTSGHGVCGLGRLSVRSIFATVVFMSSGILTVLLVSKLGGI